MNERRYRLSQLVTLPEASLRLGLAEKTLNVYRLQREDFPAALRSFGRAEVYDFQDIEKWWARQRKYRPRS